MVWLSYFNILIVRVPFPLPEEMSDVTHGPTRSRLARETSALASHDFSPVTDILLTFRYLEAV